MSTPPNSVEAPKNSAMRALDRVAGKVPPDTVPVTRPDTSRVADTTPIPDTTEPTPIVSTEFDIGEPQVAKFEDDIDKIIDHKGTSAENMKRLRTKLKSTVQEYTSTKNTLSTLQAELESAKKKLGDYESGLAVPDQLEALQTRVHELEKLEKIYKLETSKEFREAIETPLNEKKSKLTELATEYGVEGEVLEEALSAKTKAERNSILSRAFPDQLGAFEANALIESMSEIRGKASSFKADAGAAMETLRQAAQAQDLQRREEEIESLKTTARDSWTESLLSLRNDGHEVLTFRDGDTEHNDLVAKPILSKASRDYGVAVRSLGENGLKSMPKEVAYMLARSIQLAHASAILKEQNQDLIRQNAALRTRLGDLHTYNRPGANGNGSNSTFESSTREKGGVGAARSALQKVTAKR